MREYIITCDDEVAMWVGNDVETMKRIVRCGDCRYYIDSEYFHSPFCSLMNDRDTEPDGFCAWAERREP